MGPLVGLILGDVYTGLLVGGTLELVWMGMVPLAGAQPPNVVIGGVIGTAFAILTKADPKVAIGVAVPFSIAVQGCITLLFTLFSPMMHRCDRMVKELNWRGIERVNYLGISILFIFYFVVAFLPIYFGADAASAMVQKAPGWLLDGLAVAGGMMPAIGFSADEGDDEKPTILSLASSRLHQRSGGGWPWRWRFFNTVARQRRPGAPQEDAEDGI